MWIFNSDMFLGMSSGELRLGKWFLPCYHHPPMFLTPGSLWNRILPIHFFLALPTRQGSYTYNLGSYWEKSISESGGWGQQGIEGFVFNWRECSLPVWFRLNNFKTLCSSNQIPVLKWSKRLWICGFLVNVYYFILLTSWRWHYAHSTEEKTDSERWRKSRFQSRAELPSNSYFCHVPNMWLKVGNMASWFQVCFHKMSWEFLIHRTDIRKGANVGNYAKLIRFL